MLREEDGDLLGADAEALVNTVNTVGVMGKGLALQFKQAYPGNFRAYEVACRRGDVRLGSMFVWETDFQGNPRFVINFPTKGHWRARSRIVDVRAGLDDLRRVIRDKEIRSIAIPPLGCGNGGLDWSTVRPIILEALGGLPDVEVILYPPHGAPPAQTMTVRTDSPRMTPGRAALLTMVSRYICLAQTEDAVGTDGGASLLEIQKLMYFLQAAGQPLRLNYAKARYGPYADNLNHVLQALEGHYIRGYGDRTQQVLKLAPITILPGAETEAHQWLEDNPDKTGERIDAVMRLVTGFASAYGLEMLATVHWITTQEMNGRVTAPVELAQRIRGWSERKGRLFTEAHVRIASSHLAELGWITAV